MSDTDTVFLEQKCKINGKKPRYNDIVSKNFLTQRKANFKQLQCKGLLTDFLLALQSIALKHEKIKSIFR